MSEDITDTERKIQTFNILQLARDVFGGAEARLKEAIDIMDPMDLVSYLINQGWVENEKVVPPGGRVFSYGENHEVAVFVPLDKEYIDYEERMMAALQVVIDSTPLLGSKQVQTPVPESEKDSIFSD